MKTAFIYHDDFAGYSYGQAHPLKPYRLKLTYELIDDFGLLSLPDTEMLRPVMAGEDDLLLFHEKDYLEALKAANSGKTLPDAQSYGLGPGDNPVFEGLYDWSRLVAGASLQAAEIVACGKCDTAFSIAGGLHHALPRSASGFCYINDPVLAIMSLLKKGSRVAYIDIDAHHGDGVQAAFYTTDRVLTISIHETGAILFPGSGFEHETGAGEGEGYSVNIPMPPTADDEVFLHAFDEIVPPLIDTFKPDFVVTQLGVDSLRGDPLAHLNYTNNGFREVVRKIKEISPRWVALGGGGYHIANVAKAWTLAWAVMNEAEVPDDIPAAFLRRHESEGFQSATLRDAEYSIGGVQKDTMRRELDRVIGVIKSKVFRKLRI